MRKPISATSQPVPVVPTLAPNTRPRPCGKVRSPALTRPIVVIVTALDDCTSSVMIAPQKAPESGVAAALPSTMRRTDPASAFNPSVMTAMPSRNSPMPPTMAMIVDIRVSSRLFFRLPLLARRGEIFHPLRRDFRIFGVELLHGLDDRSRDDEAREPFVVGGHDEPRGRLGGRRPDRLFIGLHVVFPVSPLANV